MYDFLGLVDFIDGAEIGMNSLAISIGKLMGFSRSGKNNLLYADLNSPPGKLDANFISPTDLLG